MPPRILDPPQIGFFFFCSLMNRYFREKTEKAKMTVCKSDPFHLVVDRAKSIVKWIIFMLSFLLKTVLANIKFCVSQKLVLSNNLSSMLTKLLRGIQHSLLYREQWRKKWMADSVSLPQLHMGLIVSWKLFLNICSCRWLRPSRIRVIYLIAIGLWQSKNKLEEGLMNFNTVLLKYCDYHIFLDWGLICSIQL